MTTLHKLNDDTLIMTLSTGKQYLISNEHVTVAEKIATDDLEAIPFDTIVAGMLDNAQTIAAQRLSFEEISMMMEFVQDKIEDFE